MARVRRTFPKSIIGECARLPFSDILSLKYSLPLSRSNTHQSPQSCNNNLSSRVQVVGSEAQLRNVCAGAAFVVKVATLALYFEKYSQFAFPRAVCYAPVFAQFALRVSQAVLKGHPQLRQLPRHDDMTLRAHRRLRRVRVSHCLVGDSTPARVELMPNS